jgi:hypothetical protein
LKNAGTCWRIPDILRKSVGRAGKVRDADPKRLFREEEDVMRRDNRILLRTIDQTRRRANPAQAVSRTVGMVISVEQAYAGNTTCGRRA